MQGYCMWCMWHLVTAIIIIINLIYIAQFDTNGILTALYIVITYIQMQYVHVWTYMKQSYKQGLFLWKIPVGQLTHSIKNQWANLKINGSSVTVAKTIKGKAQTDIIYIQSIVHNENKIDFFLLSHVLHLCIQQSVYERVCVCVWKRVCLGDCAVNWSTTLTLIASLWLTTMSVLSSVNSVITGDSLTFWVMFSPTMSDNTCNNPCADVVLE